jgi:hypothetical protein
MPIQIHKVKCPYCGWIRHIELDVEGDQVTVVKGIAEKVEAFLANFKNQGEAEGWVDMPPCPHCDRPYQYNPDTGETRK